MKFYLAEITYEKDYYEGKTERNLKAIRLVKAESVEEAQVKAEKSIRDKSSDYSISYYVTGINISECIE